MPLTSSSSSTLFNFQFHGSKWTLQSHTNQTHFSSLQLHKTLFVFYPGPSNNPIRPTIQQYQTSNSKRKWKRTWRFPSIFSFFLARLIPLVVDWYVQFFFAFFFFSSSSSMDLLGQWEMREKRIRGRVRREEKKKDRTERKRGEREKEKENQFF